MATLDAISKSDLIQFLADCATVTDIDTDLALQIATSHIQSHDGREFNLKHLRRITDLKKRWQTSLKRNQPDFSVYSDTYYVYELWLCWIRYSRRYLRDIGKDTSLFTRSIVSDIQAQSILDSGNTAFRSNAIFTGINLISSRTSN